MDYIPHTSNHKIIWQEHCLNDLMMPLSTIQQWMAVEDPDGQNIWIRQDGATRGSAPFAIET
eukprot:7152762-Prorocentrum_lima.AAC.1